MKRSEANLFQVKLRIFELFYFNNNVSYNKFEFKTKKLINRSRINKIYTHFCKNIYHDGNNNYLPTYLFEETKKLNNGEEIHTKSQRKKYST